MSAPVTHFLPITTIRRERLLPQPGKVLVRARQTVNPLDIVAESNVDPDYQWLDLSRVLGLPPAKVDRYIQCHAGDLLASGDIIAGPVGISNKVVRAQKECKVILAGDGQVLLEITGKPFQLKAGLPGDVMELIPDLGVVIETSGALIQGVWGNDCLDVGELVVLAKRPNHPLEIKDLDISLRGLVLLCGHCGDAEALKMANELSIRGLIVSSLKANLLPIVEQMHFPIVVIDGFGDLPLNSTVYKLLASNNRREVVVNANHWDRFRGVRPEVLIPLPAPGNTKPPQDTAEFVADKTVRVLREPFQGKIGTIIRLKNRVTFPSGLNGQGAEVRFEDGNHSVLPLANLEIIG